MFSLPFPRRRAAGGGACNARPLGSANLTSGLPDWDFTTTAIGHDVPRPRAMPGETLAVLTRDLTLLQTVKALAVENRIAAVSGESDLAGELVGRHAGVAIIDADAVATPIEQLTERLKAQLPDVVLIVAGRLDGHSALAAQITKGTVYRFLAKPASEQRLRLFVEAAWRRRNEDFAAMGATIVAPATAQTGISGGKRGGLSGAILALMAVGLLGGWLYLRHSGPDNTPNSAPAASSSATGRAPESTATTPVRDPQLEDLLNRAERAVTAHRLDEAQKLADQARSLEPDNVRVAFLAAQIGKQRERMVPTRPRQPVASSNISPAGPVMDGPVHEEIHATPIAQAGQVVVAPQTTTQTTEVAPQTTAQTTQAAPQTTAQTGQWVPQAAGTPEAPSRTDPARDAAPVPVPTAEVAASQPASQPQVPAPQVPAPQVPAPQPQVPAPQPQVPAPQVAPPTVAQTQPQQPAAQPMPAASRQAPAQQAPAQPVPPSQQPGGFVPAASLKLARFTAPTFPVAARQRGISGWVDVQFVVRVDGSVADVSVIGSQPAGMFEQAALDAVRKWQYKPVQQDGRGVEQRTRLRLKFALEN